MKLNKTLKLKIGELSNNKKNKLNILLRKNTKAINFCLQKAKQGNIITHELVYQDLRKLNLPATIVNGCRAKSVEIIKSYYKLKKRKPKIKFPELNNSKVRFDNQVVKLRHTSNNLYPKFISLLYKAGKQGKHNNRIELPLVINSNYQREIIKQINNNYKLGASELVKYKGEFYIYISYSKEVEIPKPDKTFNPIGVDIGINNLAVSVAQSTVKFFNGKRVKWKNQFFREQREILQENFALQEIKRLRGRQTRYNNHYIHKISKNIIEQAKKEEKPVIVMEDLTYIRDTSKVRKKQNYTHHTWIFKRLQKAIEYKANWEKIPVVYLDPYYTSKICSNCGKLNKRTKHTYKCKFCNYEVNADYNAGRNISNCFFDAISIEEQASINHASNSIKPESAKNRTEKDGIVRNFKRKEVSFS